MKKFTTTIAILFCIFSLDCYATAQTPDSITIKNESYLLYTNPLDEYLAEIKWERPKQASISSGNWRGYLASWKIEAGNMFLEDVTIALRGESIDFPRKRGSILKDLFPNKKYIVATWYSGALIIPHGKRTNYVHMGYGSTYEKYIVLRIDKGIVIEHLNYSSSQFDSYKNRKFQAFKETTKFQKELKELMVGEHKRSEEETINFMKSFYAEYYLSL